MERGKGVGVGFFVVGVGRKILEDGGTDGMEDFPKENFERKRIIFQPSIFRGFLWNPVSCPGCTITFHHGILGKKYLNESEEAIQIR